MPGLHAHVFSSFEAGGVGDEQAVEESGEEEVNYFDYSRVMTNVGLCWWGSTLIRGQFLGLGAGGTSMTKVARKLFRMKRLLGKISHAGAKRGRVRKSSELESSVLEFASKGLLEVSE